MINSCNFTSGFYFLSLLYARFFTSTSPISWVKPSFFSLRDFPLLFFLARVSVLFRAFLRVLATPTTGFVTFLPPLLSYIALFFSFLLTLISPRIFVPLIISSRSSHPLSFLVSLFCHSFYRALMFFSHFFSFLIWKHAWS